MTLALILVSATAIALAVTLYLYIHKCKKYEENVNVIVEDLIELASVNYERGWSAAMESPELIREKCNEYFHTHYV